VLVVGTGPTELHAHIDLDERARARLPRHFEPRMDVLATSEHRGEWSVVAELHPDSPRTNGGGE